MPIRALLAPLVCLTVLTTFASAALADHHKAKIMEKQGVGKYIADAKGMTLYYFKKDGPEKSACSGDCLKKWPPYSADKVDPQAGLDAKDFSTIKRDDGTVQVTFRGYPLYYFFQDKAPGDTLGQGVGNVWYVVDPGAFPPK